MRCQICPHIRSTMDGPICSLAGDFVFPEGREGVPDWCPLGYESDPPSDATDEATEVAFEDMEDYEA